MHNVFRNARHCISFSRNGINLPETIFLPSSTSTTNRKFSAQRTEPEYDVVIVGGGIVGMAAAREMLMRHPNLKFAVVEKENRLAAHQSGHNSGVIHGGIYYKPGSLKAKLCVEGLKLSYKYFDEKGIPYKKCGKLIVAVDKEELPRLDDLYNRGIQNGVPDIQMVDGAKIKEIEPYCQGLKAVWSPHTGIVDWGLVTQYYSEDFKALGGDIHLSFEVKDFNIAQESKVKALAANKKGIQVIASNGQSVRCQYVLTCGGLQSDRLAELSGCSREPRIVPIRGEYLLLNPKKTHLVKGNIYPVPDPHFPFLGVHFTPRMDGSVWLGPNAVLALKREGYSWGDINLRDIADSLSYRGFQKLALKNVSFGIQEMFRSAFIGMAVKELQKYIPQIQATDISRGPAGVRAQALGADGSLIEDFVFDYGMGETGRNIIHCRNTPSPGATSSLAIAKMIADKADADFLLK